MLRPDRPQVDGHVVVRTELSLQPLAKTGSATFVEVRLMLVVPPPIVVEMVLEQLLPLFELASKPIRQAEGISRDVARRIPQWATRPVVTHQANGLSHRGSRR